MGSWWRYQAIRHPEPYDAVAVHEVYFDCNDKLVAWTDLPIQIHADDCFDSEEIKTDEQGFKVFFERVQDDIDTYGIWGLEDVEDKVSNGYIEKRRK